MNLRFAHTFHELGRAGGMSLTVKLYGELHQGCPATRWEPEEPPEFDVSGAMLFEVCNSDGDCITAWAVKRGWRDALKRLAIDLAGDPKHYGEVLESACEEAAAEDEWLRDEAADRRLNEMRGK